MSSLFAFPGQGAQQPGMLYDLPDAPEVRDTLDEASAILQADVRLLDSAEALKSTRAVQLCLLLAGVACSRMLLARSVRPDYVSGLSIGAYPAAVISGALDLADAVRLVSLRGTLMEQAWPGGHGMMALMGLDLGEVEALLARVHGPETPVYLANINAETQLVVAGSDAALSRVAELARQRGTGVARRLAVSVPSHCELLAEPARELARAFAEVEIRRPGIRYLSSSSARLVVDPEALRDDLAFNMCRVVDWLGVLGTAYERGVRLHLELPPGTVLSGLARREIHQGTVIAFQGSRLDTLAALMQQEAARTH